MENNEQLGMQGGVAEYFIIFIDKIISTLGGNNRGGDSSGSTPVELQHELGHPPPSGGSSSISRPASLGDSEKKMAVFIRRLVIIKKIFIVLGQLIIAWATVFHLSGFVSASKPKDLWFVTTILAVIGSCLFSPSRIFSQPKEIGLSADVLLPYLEEIFESKNINHFFYWLQILAAGACGTISLMRLGQQDYGKEAQEKEIFVLNVFYGLSLAEALMFLLEKGYWTWRIEYGKLVERVNEELELGSDGMVYLCGFFKNAYSKCLASSIFDGLKMDLIAYAGELLCATSSKEQIIGASILHQFVENQRFANDTLSKIRDSTPVTTRLIEMLQWNDFEEKDIRLSASKIISKLASQHPQRVAVIPEAMKSIASLLHTGGTTEGRPHEASPRMNVVYHGLMVVKNLISDTGGMGRALRNDILKSDDLMSNIQELLKYSHQMLVLEILTSLGMDAMVWENIEKRRGMLWSILQVFFCPLVEEEDKVVCNKAGEALVMLVHDNNTNCEMMLRQNDVVKDLIVALDKPVLREHADKILKDLLHYSTSSCQMIQNEQGMLKQIIYLTSVNEPRMNVVHHALNMVKTLVCATGDMERALQNYFLMSENLMRNIQELLECRSHLKHQMLGLEILTCLGMDAMARENIGKRRGMLWSILQVFFRPIVMEEDKEVCNKAGEALTALILNNNTNCEMMLKHNDVVKDLIVLLDNPVLREHADKILKDLLHYSISSFQMIQNEQGMLEQIIYLTSVNELRMNVVYYALKMVKTLVCATGEMERALQNYFLMSENLMRNIQELLECRSHLKHQMLGLEILTCLGMDTMARENIGKSRGMLWSILQVFFRPIVMEEDKEVCNKAGEALAMLILDNNTNCEMMLKHNDVVKDLIVALDNPVLREHADKILKDLVHYSTSSCQMIQNEQDMLEQITDLTNIHKQEMNVVHHALIKVKTLICTTGETKRALQNYFLMSKDLMRNIHELLKCGRSHLKHQVLGLGILKRLAHLGMDGIIKDKFGRGSIMLCSILQVFFRPIETEEDGAVCNEAGEALTALILDSKNNCKMMLWEDDDVVRNLVAAMDNPMLRLHAANILRGLLYYSTSSRLRVISPLDSEQCNSNRFDELHIVVEKMSMVFNTIMTENDKLLEVSVGLALQIFKIRKFTGNEIKRAGINDEDLARKLVDILKGYNNPESKVPKMKILVIGLTIALMKYNQNYIQLFRNLKIDQVLIQFAETSKTEGFSVFTTYRDFKDPLSSTLIEESSMWLWKETSDLIREADRARWINLGTYAHLDLSHYILS